MRIRTYDILDGIESATEHQNRTVAVFGEGRTAISVSYDNYGNLRVHAYDVIKITPRASNTFIVQAEE